MWEGSIETVVEKIRPPETILVLGASDTGKTTFAVELAMRLAKSEPVAFVDADIGQSRIGPPATIGWSVVDSAKKDLSQFDTRGIFFVGAVSPVGHLLQYTAALVKCVRQAAARIILIDTPGFVGEPAARSLWWTVQDILRPTKILLLQRDDEMKDFISGARGFDSEVTFITTPPQVPLKSMSQRQAHRQQKFGQYLHNSSFYQLSLNRVAFQARENITADTLIHRIIAMKDSGGNDLAVGRIIKWDVQNGAAVVEAPKINIDSVACLIIGDVWYEGNGT
jgi:polynucleotide 5'-hydroxyl-kinase GRC3/NOL9